MTLDDMLQGLTGDALIEGVKRAAQDGWDVSHAAAMYTSDIGLRTGLVAACDVDSMRMKVGDVVIIIGGEANYPYALREKGVIDRQHGVYWLVCLLDGDRVWLLESEMEEIK